MAWSPNPGIEPLGAPVSMSAVARGSASSGGGRARRALTLAALVIALAVPTLAFGRVATQIQVKDNAFSPQAPALRTFQHGASFQWQRAGGSFGTHNVRQDDRLFRSGNVTAGPINYTISASAGSYHYYCELHGSRAGGMAGAVKVRPTFNAAPVGNPFTVIWADSAPNTGKAFDVRYRIGTAGTWHIWRND